MSRVYGGDRARGRVQLRRALLLLGLMVAAIAAAPAQAEAAYGCTKYADAASGNDATGDGSITDPYATVTKLVTSLAPGNVGCLKGTFTANITLEKADITLTSTSTAESGRATINAKVTFANAASGVTLAGLKLNGTGLGTPLLHIHSDDVTLLGNEIYSNDAGGNCIFAGPSDADPARRLRIEGNKIHDCAGSAIGLQYTRDAVITDNYVYDNPGRGVQLYPDAEGTVVRNNVLDRNDWALQLGGSGEDATVGSRITDNVLTRSVDVDGDGSHLLIGASYDSGAAGSDNLITGTCHDSSGPVLTSDHYTITGSIVTGGDPYVANSFYVIRSDDLCAGRGPLPLAVTGDSSSVAQRSATVSGQVNPHFQGATFVVEYGTTRALGSATAAVAAGAGSLPVPVTTNLAGLAPATTYHWRVVAENASGGRSFGEIRTFTTAALPDADADGMPDELDACDDVPRGEFDTAPADGCPDDRDGDGVLDQSDACKDTVRGAFDTNPADGCPDDSDGDGVLDQNDGCKDKPAPAGDPDGCPDPAPKPVRVKVGLLNQSFGLLRNVATRRKTAFFFKRIHLPVREAGAKVRVSCGPRCGIRTRTLTTRRSQALTFKWLVRKRLPLNSKVTIRVTKPGKVAVTIRLALNRKRSDMLIRRTCTPPGGRSVRC